MANIYSSLYTAARNASIAAGNAQTNRQTSDTYQGSDWVSMGWAVGALGQGIGQAMERVSAVDAYSNRVKALELSYNWAISESQRQANSVNKALRSELFNQQLNARQNQATVNAALAETGRESRGTGKIQQAMQAQTAIAEAGAISTAKQKIEDINSQMQAAYVQTSEQINSIYKAGRTSWASDAMSGLMGAIRGGMSGAQAMRGFSLYF